MGDGEDLGMVDHWEKDGLLVDHLLGKLMCQLLNQESQKSDLVVYEGLEVGGK